MKFVGLILTVIFLLISGCTQQPEPTELPADFEITSGSGAMHLEWGWNSFNVDSSGKASYQKGMGIGMIKNFDFKVTEEELLEVYKVAVKNNFFNLNDNYEDPFVMDGGWEKIEITANGTKKSVQLSNISNEQFAKVDTAIYEMIKRNAPKVFEYEFIDDCENKKTECKAYEGKECGSGDVDCISEKYDCEEWISFCGWEIT